MTSPPSTTQAPNAPQPTVTHNSLHDLEEAKEEVAAVGQEEAEARSVQSQSNEIEDLDEQKFQEVKVHQIN